MHNLINPNWLEKKNSFIVIKYFDAKLMKNTQQSIIKNVESKKILRINNIQYGIEQKFLNVSSFITKNKNSKFAKTIRVKFGHPDKGKSVIKNV